MKRLLRNPHFLSVSAQGLTACLGFGSFLVLVRALDPSVFGIWALYLAAATVLDMARSGFVHSGLVRYASGDAGEEQRSYVGSGLLLTAVATVVLALPVGIVGLFMDSSAGDWKLFFTWWPLLGLASLPVQFASWVQQAGSRFDRVLTLRIVVNGSFLVLVVTGFLLDAISIQSVIVFQIVAAALGSSASMLTGWFRVGDARRATRASTMDLARFGLFSTGTLIGANALKSSDTFLLGALLGPMAVGLYTAAQRAVEALEIPLRGLSASLYPELSRQTQRNEMLQFRQKLVRTIAVTTLGLLPLSVGLMFGAELVIRLVAGSEYLDAAPALTLFAVAILFLPADRFTGLALDSLGRPGLNTTKVLTMVSINVVGDVLAILTLGTIEAVAAVTCIMMATGAILGIALVWRELRATADPYSPTGAPPASVRRLAWRRS